jgi:uncharacterized protein YktA (UPF0223 family)
MIFLYIIIIVMTLYMVNYFFVNHTEQLQEEKINKKKVIETYKNYNKFIGSIDGIKNRRFTRY